MEGPCADDAFFTCRVDNCLKKYTAPTGLKLHLNKHHPEADIDAMYGSLPAQLALHEY